MNIYTFLKDTANDVVDYANDTHKKLIGNIPKTIILCGKMGSGKTTIKKLLKNRWQLNDIVTYTTRPIRPGEVNHKDYHFCSENEFLKLIDSEFFAEYQTFNATFGKCYYGSAKDSFISNSIIVMDPLGIKEIHKKLKSIFVIYLKVNDNEILKKRALGRGDDIKEIERRLKSDDENFMNIEKYCDVIINIDEDMSPENIASEIGINLIETFVEQ